MKYLFDKQHNIWIEECRTIRYEHCHDGISVQGGSLLGSGFQPYDRNGVTLPAEIEGIPVTELSGTFHAYELGYIEARELKRINITIMVGDSFLYPYIGRCNFPWLGGGLQRTLESIRITFIACNKENTMRINPMPPEYHRCTEEIIFHGTVIDDPDWDCSYFERGLFQNCTGLKTIYGVFQGYTLDGGTFAGCTALTQLPKLKVKHLSDGEFRDCTSLRNIHLSDKLTQIGGECFQNCISLEDIYIPDSVEYVGSGAFEGCKQLKTIHLSKCFCEIRDRLFYGCEKLRKVFLSDDIRKIGSMAFAGCTALSRPWFPDGLLSIGDGAFRGCRSMREIYLPESLVSIGKDAFADCGDLVIHGKAGTLAEKYARENNIPFIVL